MAVINGTDGDDTLVGTEGADFMRGFAGADVLQGAGGSDLLWGGDGDDRMFGGDGNDLQFGGGGADQFIGDRGNDVLLGGQGVDTVSYVDLAEGPVRVDLARHFAFDGRGGTDQLRDIENVDGTFFDDVLIGDRNDNRIAGEFGRDTMTGGRGADAFFWNDSADFGDVIVDFVSGTDRLEFDRGEVLRDVLPAGPVAAASIVNGPAPEDGDDHFIFDPATGILTIDLNGSGPGLSAAVASLTGVARLQEGDIWVV
ncbi:MAG: hypothetical protein H3C38_13315 [Rhodospirillales bacterium]|nr:hypothetical protein [Rhodospirillales bacterium]